MTLIDDIKPSLNTKVEYGLWNITNWKQDYTIDKTQKENLHDKRRSRCGPGDLGGSSSSPIGPSPPSVGVVVTV